MARSGDGGPLQVEPMKAPSEPSPLGDRFRLLKHSVIYPGSESERFH
jgi:hypothetical protein